MQNADIKIISIVECVHCHSILAVDLDDTNEICKLCGGKDFTPADRL